MAVAGFAEDDIAITAQENSLVIAGKGKADEGREFLYRGIAGRSFERRFELADPCQGRRREPGERAAAWSTSPARSPRR